MRGESKFLIRQLNRIKKGGWNGIHRRLNLVYLHLKQLLNVVLLFPCLLPLVLIIRVIRPWIIVRIGHFESAGIGHFSLPIEIYLGEIDCGINQSQIRKLDIWYLDCKICNSFLEKKWRKYFFIGPRWILVPLNYLNQLIPGGHLHQPPFRHLHNLDVPWQCVDIHNVLNQTRCHLEFSQNEILTNSEMMKIMGVNTNDHIVCFSVRDNAYHRDVYSQWTHRDADVKLFLPAMEKLANENYKVVRMGAKVKEALNTKNSNVIDYACNGMRNEQLDIFLVSSCKFMIGTGTGIEAVALAFRKPLVLVNLAQFGFIDEVNESVIFIPRFFWSVHENRMLTFKEIFLLGAHLFSTTRQYRTAGIESVDNSDEDIQDVVTEMEKRINGEWKQTVEEESLQRKFCEVWPRRKNSQALRARIGTKFILKHQEMLK